MSIFREFTRTDLILVDTCLGASRDMGPSMREAAWRRYDVFETATLRPATT
jgi:hypothetical protein